MAQTSTAATPWNRHLFARLGRGSRRGLAGAVLLVGLGLPVVGAGVFADEPSAASAPASSAPLSAAEIETYRAHLLTLADPGMEGRGPGLTGNRRAAEYLEHHFREMGLEPAFESGTRPGGDRESPSYFQRFTAGREVVVRSASVVFAPPGDDETARIERQTLVKDRDYVVLGNSGTGAAEGPLAFVGYSIEAGGDREPVRSEDASYIESDDLTGKIAVLLRFEPLNDKGKSRLTEKGNWSAASAISQKIMNAVRRNAAGIILVSPPGADDPRTYSLESPASSAAWTRQLDIPAIMMTQPAAERLLKAADPEGRSLLALRKLADQGRTGKAEDESAVLTFDRVVTRIEAAVEREDRVTWNVGGVLPGSGDLASEYIVIGAHFDHVGLGYTGGSRNGEYGKVHPGADDNASGTSGLLLAAEKLARAYRQENSGARRSILFLGFSAEEMGLIGSREFIKDSPIEAKNITAMLNMDMIGRLRPDGGDENDPGESGERLVTGETGTLHLHGTGTAEGFEAILKPVLDASGLTIKASPGGRGPSDHATFYAREIPVLHFFTGLHAEYHTPLDTADLINVQGAVRIVETVCDVAEMLAARPEPLVFRSAGSGERAGREDTPGPRLGAIKVRFGIAPGNYAEEGEGVAVGEVFDGTSAAEAGIQPGDMLTKWNGQPIEDVGHWMTFLAQHKPGDVVDVTLMRRKDAKDKSSQREEHVVRVTLKARDQAAR